MWNFFLSLNPPTTYWKTFKLIDLYFDRPPWPTTASDKEISHQIKDHNNLRQQKAEVLSEIFSPCPRMKYKSIVGRIQFFPFFFFIISVDLCLSLLPTDPLLDHANSTPNSQSNWNRIDSSVVWLLFPNSRSIGIESLTSDDQHDESHFRWTSLLIRIPRATVLIPVSARLISSH